MRQILPSFIVACATVLMMALSNVQSFSYVADVRFYVDSTAYKIYQSEGVKNKIDLTTTIQELVDEMNTKYYSSLTKYGLDLQLKLEQIIVDANITASQSSPINPQELLRVFERYLRRNNQYKQNFDLTMMLTGLDMKRKTTKNLTKDVEGIAYFYTICGDTLTSGVAEVVANKNIDGYFVAHELGHILGANHDSECGFDNSNLGNLMNGYGNRHDPDRFQFSYCSASYFQKKFKSMGDDNCLLDSKISKTSMSTPAPTTTAPNAPRPARLVPVIPDTSGGETPDEVCERLSGTGNRLFRKFYLYRGYGDSFCRQMKCIKNNGNYTISTHKTPDGMPCAPNKRCKDDTCQPGQATSFTEACPWGDQDLTVWNFKPCSVDSCRGNNWQNDWCCTYCSKRISGYE